MTDAADTPGIRYPPPLIYVAGFGIGLLLDKIVPLSIGEFTQNGFGQTVALAISIAGGILLASAMVMFLKNRTAIYPSEGAAAMVVSGPYRITRNPMYLGLFLVYLGGVIFINSVWPLIMLPFVIICMRRFVIAKEEAHLRARFGQSYVDYKESVRRWL